MPGVLGEYPAGQVGGLGHRPQQRLVGRDLAGFGADRPFTDHDRSLAAFAAGIVVSSLIWHPALGAGVGYLAPRLSERRLTGMARAGGVSMAMIGVALLVV